MAAEHRSIPPMTLQDVLRFFYKVRVPGIAKITEDTIARLMDALPPEECWEWVAGKTGDGYGHFALRNQGNFAAARVIWTMVNGPIPEGFLVCHHCDNRSCVNPRHLFLGTTADNVRDRDQKGRGGHGITGPKNARGEVNGRAKLTEQDIRQIRLEVSRGVSVREIANRLGVTRQTIYHVVRRIIWKHVV